MPFVEDVLIKIKTQMDEEGFNKATKGVNRLTKAQRTFQRLSVLSGISTSELETTLKRSNIEINRKGKAIDIDTNKSVELNKVVTRLKGTHRKFRMELLSVMFAGMAVSKAYDSMIKPAKDLTGQTEMWATTLQVAFLPAVTATTPAVMKLQMGIMGLNEDMLMAGGILTMVVGWGGKLAMTFGMTGLALDGFRKAFHGNRAEAEMFNHLIEGLTGKMGTIQPKLGLFGRGLEKLKGAFYFVTIRLGSFLRRLKMTNKAMTRMSATGGVLTMLTISFKKLGMAAAVAGKAMIMALAPLAIPLLIIGSLLVGLLILYLKWDDIAQGLTKSLDENKDGTISLGEVLQGIMDKLSGKDVWKVPLDTADADAKTFNLTDAMDSLTKKIAASKAFILITDVAQGLLDTMKSVLEWIWNGLSKTYEFLINTGPISSFISLLEDAKSLLEYIGIGGATAPPPPPPPRGTYGSFSQAPVGGNVSQYINVTLLPTEDLNLSEWLKEQADEIVAQVQAGGG